MEEPGETAVKQICLWTGGSVTGYGWHLKWWTGSRRIMPRSWVLLQEAEHCIRGIAVGWGKPSSTSLVSSRWFLSPDASSLIQLMDQGFISTCTKLYLKQASNAALGLLHCDFWWFIPSCMPSLIFRLDGQIWNPLQMQTGGRYGQRAVTSSRRFGKPALEVCVEVSDDFTELVTLGRWRDSEGAAWALDNF